MNSRQNLSSLFGRLLNETERNISNDIYNINDNDNDND